MKRRICSVFLSLAMLLSLPGCATASAVAAEDLMKGVTATPVFTDADWLEREECAEALTGFSVELFQNSVKGGENTLVSPLSVLSALAMTANGAGGETLTQMEAASGLPMDQLNEYLRAYRAALANTEKAKLHIANSIWFKDTESFAVGRDFLQSNADYYGAGAYKGPFDDTTRDDINNWVKENTDGMIPAILDNIPGDAVMYLVNALAFDAEWADPYKESQVRAGTFTTEDCAAQDVKLMWSEESDYVRDELAQGFIRPYAGGNYSFVALLPNEGVTVAEYVASLTGEGLAKLLGAARSVPVDAALPKFEAEYGVEMSEILRNMGMTDAFDSNRADLSGLGSSTEGNLYISRVLHKTYISVDEKGTKAAAVTAVEVVPECAPIEERYSVILDRPFVYFIVDQQTKLPIFMGTVMKI